MTKTQNQASLAIRTATRGARRIASTYGGAQSLGALADRKPMTRAEVKAWRQKMAMKPCVTHQFGGLTSAKCRRCGFERVVVNRLALSAPSSGASLAVLDAKLAAITASP